MKKPTEEHDDSDTALGPQELAFESRLRSLRPSKLSTQTETLFDIRTVSRLGSWRQFAATVAASWLVGAMFGGAAIWTWMSSTRNTSELIASPNTEAGAEQSIAVAAEMDGPMPLRSDWGSMDSFLDKHANFSPRSLGFIRGRLIRGLNQSVPISADLGDSLDVSVVSETPLTQQELLQDVLQSMRVN